MASILHKRKAADPSASDLTVGELAINTTDGGLFTKTSGGSVIEVGSGAGSISDDAVTFAKMQNISEDHFIGRNASGVGDPTQLNASEARAVLNVENGATADQTNAEIRAAVEAASDSNVFTDDDHSKLNGIEASATADQTNAEIRAAVEAASDSNVFTDADHSKLNGIESSATADQSASEIIALIAGETIAPGVITTTNLTIDFGSVA